MPENQNTEWKRSWRDEYLKWICGFANAKGGKLFIGKDDNGEIVGLKNSKKLLEDIPSKIQNSLGIVCDVNLHETKSGSFIEIVVFPEYNPINYKGQYHYRTGSVKQELKGSSLDRFLLSKYGRKWDAVPVPNITIGDLSQESIELFKRMAASAEKRNYSDILDEPNDSLLDKLHLIEGDYLTRAAILLFHPQPEKYIVGAYVKIGYFESDDNLIFQDQVKGSIFHQVDKILDLLLTKYLKSAIHYEGMERKESFPFPEPAIREAILNAIAHKDYSDSTPIQISVYEDKIIIWNPGLLPQNWTFDVLMHKHPSKPFNPKVAEVLFRAGYIEVWGRGTINMINECKYVNLPTPIYKYENSGFIVNFYRFTKPSLIKNGLKKELSDIIIFVQSNGAITNLQVQELCDVSKRTATTYLQELESEYLLKEGSTGRGTKYVLK